MARGPFRLVCVYLAVSLSLGSISMTDLKESRPLGAKGEEDIWGNCCELADDNQIRPHIGGVLVEDGIRCISGLRNQP